jgi:hypothetical protein
MYLQTTNKLPPTRPDHRLSSAAMVIASFWQALLK